MMPSNMESMYASVVMVDDMNRQHRAELMRSAQHERLTRLVSDDRRTLSRTILTWAGRRLVASGQYLLRRADRPASDLARVAFEQQ